jgi:NADH-quinone oxidoreductase subunit G
MLLHRYGAGVGGTMDKIINFKINGTSVEAINGETILQVARREGIYIPTMCYLAKTTPNASCRMCVVEVKDVDGFVLSCNTPPTEGAEINTDSDILFKERQNIMKLYNVNHPLQCGVCDKSGECDLQNNTLEFELDEQSFATKDQARKKKKWGVLSYDPALCIMCEKCTAVCNQVVGSSALYIKPGGYKSVIDNHFSSCIQCGECISVCPVGAMASSDFKYTSNVWELKQIPSACAHCSSACNLNYEVKNNAIYRVTNEDDYDSLCGAGRFGYDYENRVEAKDEDAFNTVVEKFKKAKSIEFSSMITNEEAYILQEMKNQLGVKLINEDARAYKEFLEAYSSVSGESLYSADLSDIAKSDYAISLGCAISSDNPMVRFGLSQAVKNNKAWVAVVHPIEDYSIQNIITQYMKHEVGSEEAILSLLCEYFVSDEAKEQNKSFFDSIDAGYICGESSVGEEEFDLLAKHKNRKNNPVLILGADLYKHPEAKNIAKMAGLLDRYSDFKVIIIPSDTNTLGVSLICDLDEEDGVSDIGYNMPAITTISAVAGSDLDMPALNQQEGTFTTIDKEVVPLNAALPYNGYELSDIANALGIYSQYVIDYTAKLPLTKGFGATKFDDLPNYYKNDGTQVRGYKLAPIAIESEYTIDEIADIREFNGTVLYSHNPISQFNVFTDQAHQIVDKNVIMGSQQFADAAKIKGGEDIKFTIDGVEHTRHFIVSNKLKGTVALNPNFDTMGYSTSYRYKQVKIERV